MKKLPIGIQSIKKILSDNEYVYIDKTGFIKKLIDEGASHYFLSRPRRFGKSLFLNTLEEVFNGNKELFRECEIYKSDYEWKEHPVIYLDFAQIDNETPEQFERDLKEKLQEISEDHKISIKGPSIKSYLRKMIAGLAKNNPVVVLVDEYDQPIINNLSNLKVAEKNRDILKKFFESLKSLDRYLKFTFTTGVSKFSQVSLFSGYNNLKDITMNPKYAGMMGYTEEELKHGFKDYIHSIAKKRSSQGILVSECDVLDEVRTWYNGYRFSKGKTCVYNPFSTLNFMGEKEAQSYWYSTGTPSFLINEIKKHPQSVIPLSGTSALKSALSDISKVDHIKLSALMFQTGYLTIRGYNAEENSYQLDFPNREVKEAFFNSLIQEFTEIDPLDVSRAAKEVKSDLENLDLDCFISKMNVHFAKMPYHIFSKAKEGFYQAVFFTFLEKSGIKTSSEISTNIGRIDLMTETDQLICIFELKLDQTADIALTQAETKKYRERFAQSEKQTLVVGVNFSSQSRNIDGWKGRLFSPSGDFIKDILPNPKI
ncbi:MAG: AAA family ATPase [Halobacteriovoraceae bacterium]|nr:AAA family ATPase [Halobacteriovoraceae bacterium]